MKEIEFIKFLNLVDQTYHRFNWRYGQTLMNVLYSVNINKHDDLVASGNDCYYDDGKVKDVLQKLAAEWK